MMNIKRMTAIFLVLILLVCPVSCGQRKQTPPKSQKDSEEKSKGYLIFINTDTPKTTVLYSAAIGEKEKKKLYDKNPLSAAGYGGKIAFTAKESNKINLYVVNGDGSDLMKIIGDSDIVGDFLSWSSDGKYIAFAAKQPTDKNDEIYYVETGEDSTPVKVTDDGYENETPYFSNDGKYIFYGKNINNNHDIYKYELFSQKHINISNNSGNDISPVISRDGTKILFLSDEGEKGKFNLYIMDFNGANRTPITSGLNIKKGSVKMSPDSSMIAFIAIGDNGNKAVHIVDINKNTVMISNGGYMAAWSNDSKKLYYTSSDEKNRKIIEYDVTEKKMKEVFKIEYKTGEDREGIKFLHFTDKVK